MITIKQDCYKGTRILFGNEKREIINKMICFLLADGFNEIQIPNIQHSELFKGKVGIENTSMMFSVKDNSDRQLTLAPEYTAIVQQLAKTTFKQQKNVKLFYIQECFRGEKPQLGRYRQFTQLGVEILNPTENYEYLLAQKAMKLIDLAIRKDCWLILDMGAKRGLDYYKDGFGFEITCNELGAQKQVCGGGEYDGGVGFAIGIDRILQLI